MNKKEIRKIKPKIAILNYGMGNLRSVNNAFKKIDTLPLITNLEKEIIESDGLILPGVGAFPEAIKNIKKIGLDKIIYKAVNEYKKPILGICLGMQLLCRISYENGKYPGLSLIDGTVRKIPKENGLRIPHVGWNDIIKKKNCPLFENIKTGASFYFVHSYFFDTIEENISLKVNYGNQITAAISKDNIFGVQFHPERSQTYGLKCLLNYANFVSSNI
ncbi:imidazole glycerol phosphate synthase subunit HisH [Prochlorococcus sp. AH-736-E15]|nr:imidazole glycerol phosphate synthase subunit HisH [Prochlorococcus sp. AH-736-E15]